MGGAHREITKRRNPMKKFLKITGLIVVLVVDKYL
jgi:hypothetical protein